MISTNHNRRSRSLQKLTPIRGRKLFHGLVPILFVQFTEANPDKGTKTMYLFLHLLYNTHHSLQKLTPIRGRKRLLISVHVSFNHSFTEANPDKGKETMRSMHFSNLCLRLQKLTPIRGRKLI